MRKEISNIRNADLQECIDAAFLGALEPLEGLPSFTESSALQVIGPAWSKHMALHCGRHFWPDANHRTAVFGFNLALERHLGLHVKMDPDAGFAMLKESKAIRPTLHAAKKLTFDELVKADHPYRRLFRDFSRQLRITDDIGERSVLFSRTS